jgi:tetratricopeptide (TPR) repeat protein
MKIVFLLIIALFINAAAAAQSTPNNPANDEFSKVNAEVVKFFREGRYDLALPQAQRSVELAQQIYGKDHLETARSMRNLGFVQLVKNDLDAAEETFEKAYEIYKKQADLDKPTGSNLAEMLERLASIKFQKQKPDEAEKLYEAALKWREKSDGADSVKTATAISALANIGYWEKDYKKASAFFSRLLTILSNNPGVSDDEKMLAFRRAECAYRKADRESEFEIFKSKFPGETEAKSKPPVNPQIVQGGMVNGKALNLAKPAYPLAARQALAEGKINTEVIIDEKGKVVFACALKPAHPALAEASENAAYESKFSPTMLNGRAVKVFGVIVYNFVR